MRVIQLTGALAFILGLLTAVFAGIPWYVYQDPVLPWWLKVAAYSMMGGILLVLLSVVIERRGDGTEALEDLQPEEGPGRDLLVQNSAEVPGREIVQTMGVVKGHIIFAVSLGKDLSALMRLIPGGELVEYTEMMGCAREAAIERMVLEAEEIGADAVINVRFVTTSVVTGAAELLAYGTAVRLNE